MKKKSYTQYNLDEMDLRELVAEHLSTQYGVEVDTTHLRIKEDTINTRGSTNHFVLIEVDNDTNEIHYL